MRLDVWRVPAKDLRCWGLGTALAALLSCRAPSSSPAWKALQSEAETAHRPFVALLLAPEKGCSCTYLEAFAAARNALAEGGQKARLYVVTQSRRATTALEAEGVPREEMVEDLDGSLAKIVGVPSEDLPYFVVVRTRDPGRHALGLRLAGPPALQRKIGGLLDLLLYEEER